LSKLIDRANENGGNDNIPIIVARFLPPPSLTNKGVRQAEVR
jgi:serine/threonine protein phosphatase PrpC